MRYMAALVATAVIGTFSAVEAQALHRPERQIEEWYQTYLGRAADPVALRNGGNLLRRRVRPEAVLANILGGAEYYQRHGATPRRFVIALHRDVAGRNPTPAELQNSVLLMSRGMARTEVARTLLQANPTLLANPGLRVFPPLGLNPEPVQGWTCLGPIPFVP